MEPSGGVYSLGLLPCNRLDLLLTGKCPVIGGGRANFLGVHRW